MIACVFEGYTRERSDRIEMEGQALTLTFWSSASCFRNKAITNEERIKMICLSMRLDWLLL